MLLVAAVALLVAQGNARDGLIERFEQRPDGTVAFLNSALESSKEAGAETAGQVLAKPRLTREDLGRYAAEGQTRPGDLLVVLSARGRLLASAGPVSPSRLRTLLRRRDVRAGLAGGFSTTGPTPGAAGGLVLTFVTPYRAGGRRRVVVEEAPIDVASFLDGALPSVPAGTGGEAYVTGTRGRVLAATDGTRKGSAVPGRVLRAALTRGRSGTYSEAGEDHRFVTRDVRYSDWRLVVTAPEDRLLSPVSGLNRWVPWALFLGFLATMVASLALWRGAERTAESLADRERRYRALVEGVPGIVYIAGFGEDGRYLYASSRVETILGYSPEEWTAGALWAELLLPADRARAEADRERAEITGQPLRSEYRMLARDGRVVWFRDEAVVLEESSQRVLQGVMYDITGLKQAEERVKNYNRELESTVEERTRELHASRVEVLQRLSLAAEYRDDATLEHTERVGRSAALIAEQMGLDDELVLRIRHAAPLHDVGKLSTSDSILLKKDRLTGEEFERVKKHTTVGARILAGSSSETLQLAREIALSHHERWDGTGYPRGLAGADIPIAGRIVAVADVFDALSHARPYKEAWPVEEAVAEILHSSGTQFDPDVVEAFAALDHRMLTGPLARGPGVAAGA